MFLLDWSRLNFPTLPAQREMNTEFKYPTASIIEFIQELVRIPSRAELDSGQAILTAVERWLDKQGIVSKRLFEGDRTVGLYAEVSGTKPLGAGIGRWYVLNAPMDTAGFGDEAAWLTGVTSGDVHEGWLYGRGAGDAKAGVAVFSHLLARFSRCRESFAGTLGLLLDLDEHSGGFGGAKAFFESPEAAGIDGVIIGYPGIDRILLGARGFFRARLHVKGVSAHSGSSRDRGLNAVVRASELVHLLSDTPLPDNTEASFGHPAQWTVTAIAGGQGFSQVPDHCIVNIDMRLTPAFTADAFNKLLCRTVAGFDRDSLDKLETGIEKLEGWPAYRLGDDHPLVLAMVQSASQVLGRNVPMAVAGPSNIGNYLAAKGIPALCGFGVNARGLHAVDECIEIETIGPVYAVYAEALATLLDVSKERA